MITVTEIFGDYGCGETRRLREQYKELMPLANGKRSDSLADERQSWLNRWKRLRTGRA